jgi:hypothetical protein
LYYRRDEPGEFAGFLEQTSGDFAAMLELTREFSIAKAGA